MGLRAQRANITLTGAPQYPLIEMQNRERARVVLARSERSVLAMSDAASSTKPSREILASISGLRRRRRTFRLADGKTASLVYWTGKGAMPSSFTPTRKWRSNAGRWVACESSDHYCRHFAGMRTQESDALRESVLEFRWMVSAGRSNIWWIPDRMDFGLRDIAPRMVHLGLK
jgi:hypothetical protein